MHPDNIGPYSIIRKIGSGGMGNVYLGTHAETGEEVAVKVLPASMAREEGFVLRFSREIAAMRKLSNTNIVKVFEDGKGVDGSYYFSMEYVDGETLTALVSRRRRLPQSEVIDIALQICNALKAAHDAGIVHRDLKPSNLMVSKTGQVKLADFGVAHVFATTRLTRTGGVVGTAEYMSPEQARGQRATKHSDLYSLGAVMYVMLTGRPPFTGKLASDILHQHQFAQFDKPRHYVPEIHRLLEDYVCTLLEKKPDRRFPDALVAIKQLKNVRARIEFEEKAEAATELGPVDAASDYTSGGTKDRTRRGDEPPEINEHRPGAATMVRNILRADIESKLHKSPLAKFFDNTFVLIGLFALVVAAGYYLSRTSVPDPAEEFARSEKMMGASAGPSWLRAKEILEEIEENESLPDKQFKIEFWLRQVNQYEFCRRLKVSAPSDSSRDSEIQRLVRGTFDKYSGGEIATAIQQLEAVGNIIQDDPDYSFMNEFIQATLTDWMSQQNVAGRKQLLIGIANQAEKQINSASDIELARASLQAALTLYGQDASVSEELERCKKLLKDLSPASAEQSEP